MSLRVLCIVIAMTWLGSGAPSQPAPHPSTCQNPGSSGCGEHLPCNISCRCGAGLVICSQLRSCQEPGLLPTGEHTADQCHWLGVGHSWRISILVSPVRRHLLSITEKWERLVVAAVAVIYAFVPRRCRCYRDCKAETCLGQLALGEEPILFMAE